MLGIDIANKVVCFGANSETIFQGLKENVIVQLVNSHNPYIIGIFHCMAHCRNPSFGFATKAKGLQGCRPRESLGITSHTPGSVGKCEGVNLHTPKATPTLGDGIPVDSRWNPNGLLKLQKAI